MHLAFQEFKVHKVLKDHQAQQEYKEFKVHKDLKVHQV